MILVQAWRRQLWSGLGAALIVPGTLVAALIVLALAGGFGHLGALSQAFSGPSLPAGVQSVPSASRAEAPAPAALLAALALPARAPLAAGTGSPSGRGAQRAPRASRPGGRGPGGRSRVPPPRTAGLPSTTAPPPDQPTPTATDQVIGTAADVTGKLPGPIGSAATQTLRSAGSAIDRVAPLPPLGQASPPTTASLP
jgi:hypothetical protein